MMSTSLSRLLAGLLLVLRMDSYAATCDKVVLTAGPDYPPLHWYDGKSFHGASIKIATRIFADMGVPLEIRFVGPFARVLANARAGTVDVITSLKDTAERRAYLSFTTTPVFSNPVAVFVAKERPFPYSGMADLVGHRGGIVIGTEFGEPVDAFIHAHLNVTLASSVDSNFKKLEVGRIDYLITGYYNGVAYMEGSARTGTFTALKPYLTDTPNYIGFVKGSACSQYMEEFNRRLDLLVKSGAPERAIADSVREWRQAPVIVR
jgi:polar amino acid transport system substrate-binding protein